MSRFRLVTPIVPLVIPPDNVLNAAVDQGTTQTLQGISDGYWLLLPPLPAGNHSIHIHKEWEDGPVDETFALTIS
jgi:hypothetical protein